MVRVSSSVRRDVGQLLIGSLPGTTIPPEMRSLAREFGLGGVILFARNIEEPEQVAELSHDVQSLATGCRLWVSVDQEGGRVARLKSPFTVWPPMATLGRSGDAALAGRFACCAGGRAESGRDHARLRASARHPHEPEESQSLAIARLPRPPTRWRALGAAIVRGLQENGVAACGKHFPGHGDTSVDSHLDLPLVEHPPDRIRRVECVPFREAIRADVAFIMTAHVLVPSLDDEKTGDAVPSDRAGRCCVTSSATPA